MPKYVIKRQDVCAGELIKPFEISYEIFDQNHVKINEPELAKHGITNFSVSGGLVCRGMLFNVNDNGLTNDLIYTTPTNYPIEGIEPKINIKSDFIVMQYVELEELLKYLKYGVDLTQKDLNHIYKTLIICDRWLRNNHELFGWQKSGIGYGYTDSSHETIPMSIYDKLSEISCSKNGRPNLEEPEYRLIKKRK